MAFIHIYMRFHAVMSFKQIRKHVLTGGYEEGHFGSMGATQAAGWERELMSWLCQSRGGHTTCYTSSFTPRRRGQKASLDSIHRLSMLESSERSINVGVCF